MNSKLVFHPKDQTYTYLPTGERFPAETLDEFAQKKLDEAIGRLAEAYVRATNGTLLRG